MQNRFHTLLEVNYLLFPQDLRPKTYIHVFLLFLKKKIFGSKKKKSKLFREKRGRQYMEKTYEGGMTVHGSTHRESVLTSCPFWRTAFSLIERSLFSLPTARTCQAQRKATENILSSLGAVWHQKNFNSGTLTKFTKNGC